MFSIRGFDPCPEYKINFEDPNGFNLEFMLVCQTQTDDGFAALAGENVGYQYRDVVV